jgi:hypothetical protein
MEIRWWALIGSLVAVVGCAKADAAGASGDGSGGASTPASGTGGSGAAASPGFMAVVCDKTSTGTSAVRYADIAVDGVQPTSPPKVRVIECVDDVAGTSVTPGATSGTPTSGPGAPGTCLEAPGGVYFAAGHVYISCGSPSAYFSRVYVQM